MTQYHIGDIVVHGREIGTITGVDEAYRDGEDYYVIAAMNDPTLKVRTPITRSDELLRPAMSRETAEALIDKIPSIEVVSDLNTQNIQQTYNNLVKSGDHDDIIRLIKTSYSRCDAKIKSGKPRGEKDKVYLRMAERLLYSELAVALGKTYDETRRYVIDRASALGE